MCIIIAKPHDVALEESTLRRCYHQNPDGYGIMFATGNKVETIKSMGTFDEFMGEYNKLKKRTLFIHFRWRTHGDKDESNCHPFDCGAGVHLMHNGVISVPIPDEHKSDTAAFADMLRPYVESRPGMVFDPKTWGAKGLKSVTEGNRLVFLNKAGKSIFVGRWVKDKSGARFSNSNYQPFVNTYGGGHWDQDAHAWVDADGYSYSRSYSSASKAKDANLPATTDAKTPSPSTAPETTDGTTADPKVTVMSTGETKVTWADKTPAQRAADNHKKAYLRPGIYDDVDLPQMPTTGYSPEDLAQMTYRQICAVINRYPYRAATLIIDMAKHIESLGDSCRIASPVQPLDDEIA